MTVQSFTTPSITYETTTVSCTCPDFIQRRKQRNEPCKHIVALEQGRAAAFLALKAKHDYRLNGTLETRRCYLEMSLGF